MGKTIVMKCPHCGQWCIAESKGLVGRIFRGWGDAAEKGGEIGANLAGKIGLEKAGAFLGGAASAPFAYGNAVIEGLVGDKFKFDCPNCGASWGTDDEEDDQIDYYNHEQKIIEKQQLFITLGEQDLKVYINELLNLRNSAYNNASCIVTLDDMLAASYYKIGDKAKALQCISESLELCDDDNSHALKGLILSDTDRVSDKYDALQELVHYKMTDGANPYFETNTFSAKFADLQDFYASHFMEMPIERRRFIYLSAELVCLPKSFLVLPFHSLPNNVEFKGGLPMEDTLYIMHPYRTNCYIPVDSYETEIFEDEKKEFMYVMECLGAKTINFSDSRDVTTQMNERQERNYHGEGSYTDAYKASGKYDAQRENALGNSLKNEFGTKKEFDLSTSSKPYVPNNLVWYPNRQEWQRNCESRKAGRLRKASFTISTNSFESISASQKKTIEADVNILQIHANGGYEGFDKFEFSTQASHLCTCDVEFYPLSDYDKSEMDAEQKYMEELKAYITDDGRIDEKERASLERTRKNLGLSEEKAQELENRFIIAKTTQISHTKLPIWVILLLSVLGAGVVALLLILLL